MANQIHKFKDRDLKRVIKAVRASGERVARIEIDPNTGKIAVTTGSAGEGGSEPNSWNEVLNAADQERPAQARDVRSRPARQASRAIPPR